MGQEARGRGEKEKHGCQVLSKGRAPESPQERLRPRTPFPPRLACMCLHGHICLRSHIQPPSLKIFGYDSHTIKLTL